MLCTGMGDLEEGVGQVPVLSPHSDRTVRADGASHPIPYLAVLRPSTVSVITGRSRLALYTEHDYTS